MRSHCWGSAFHAGSCGVDSCLACHILKRFLVKGLQLHAEGFNPGLPIRAAIGV